MLKIYGVPVSVSEQIAVFVEDCGLHLAGPSREVFLQRPRLDRLDESVIEMQFPASAHGPILDPQGNRIEVTA